MKVDEIITQKICDKLKQGVVPWRRPWSALGGQGGLPKNLVSGKDYRGINSLILSCSGYGSPYWLTFKQAAQHGMAPMKGEKATPVVFWSRKEKTDEKEGYAFLRYYNVFNLDQCDGTKPQSAKPIEPVAEFTAIESAERIASQYQNGPALHHGGDRAYYSPARDAVHMPLKTQFGKPAEYYATLFHEYTHSTGHKSRLDRLGKDGEWSFGRHEYSKEELVAEFGAAFLCARAGIDNDTMDNTTAYIDAWLKVLKHEPKWLVWASGKASKAVDLILGEGEEVGS